MTALNSYSTGTVTIAANGTTVTGTGTIWSGTNARPGDILQIGESQTIISDVTDTSHLVIPPWGGGAQTAALYVVWQVSPQRFAGAQVMQSVNDMVAALNTTGFYVFVESSLTVPDPSLGNENQFALQASTGKLWLKTGGAWVFQGIYKGFSVKGEWNSATAYAVGDVVSLGGTSYVALAASTNQSPPNVNWQVLAAKGDTGATGPQGASYGGTSTTSLALATGAQAFTTQSGLAYQDGARVRATATSDATKWMEGVATYSGTALTITVDKINGSGTFASWNFNVVGQPGAGDLSSANNLSDLSNKTTALANLSGMPRVASRTSMAALPYAVVTAVYLAEAGREGLFVWNGSNVSGIVGIDTQQGVFVAPSSDTTGASGAWQRKYEGALNAMWFGATGALSGDAAPALQCAINVAGNGGIPLYIPQGQYPINSTLTSTLPVVIRGAGSGAGPGAVTNSLVTQITANFASGDVIHVATAYGCLFENFQINSNVGKRTSGAGIYITGNGTNNNANSIVRNVAFSGQYIDIYQYCCNEHVVTETYHQGWVRSAFVNGTNSSTNEVGPGAIYNNYFFGDTVSTTTQTACIELHSGYAHVYDNLILGAQMGIRLTIDQHDSGNPHFHHNWIEEQAISGIYVEQSGTYGCSMLQIDHNEFSNVTNVANYQSVIAITAGAATSWLESVQILGNVVRSSFSGSAYYINVQTGTNVLIANNMLNNLNSNANSYAFLTGANVAGPAAIANNVLANFADNRKYAFGNAVPVIRDPVSIAFASLPACGNGSQLFVSDGTPGSPVTGGGTGSMAFRQNGAWKGF